MPFGKRKQTINRSEQSKRLEFVGRKNEIELILDNIYLPSDAHNKKPIIGISGVGGIGKTQLLQHIARVLPGNYIVSFIDETDEMGDDVGRLINVICRNARRSGKPVTFEKTSNFIRQRNELLGHLQAAKNELPKGFYELVYAGAKLAINSTPVAPVINLIAPENAVVDVMTSLGNRFFHKRNEKEYEALLLDPKSILTKALVADMNQLGHGNVSIVLVFDTFEKIEEKLNPWILKYLIGESRDDIETNLHIIVGGRTPLSKTDPKWHQWVMEDLILEIELEPFSDEEIHEYLEVNHKGDEIDIGELAKSTSRLPLWIALWSQSGKSPQEYKNIMDLANVTNRVLRSMPSDRHREWVKTAALLRSFDQDKLSVILKDDAAPAFDWLSSQFSFVKSSTDGELHLHDVMTELISKQVWATSPDTWNKRNQALAEHFSEKAVKRASEIEFDQYKIIDTAFQKEVLEFYYYALRVSDAHYLVKSHLYGLLLESLHYDLQFFYHLSEQIENYNKNAPVKLPNLKFSLNNKSFEVFKYDLMRIAESFELTSHQRAIAHNWIGYSCKELGQYEEALSWYTKCIDIEPTFVSVYFDRAIAWQRLGNPVNAKKDLEKGKKLQTGQVKEVLKLLSGDTKSSYFDELSIKKLLNNSVSQDDVLEELMQKGLLHENTRVIDAYTELGTAYRKISENLYKKNKLQVKNKKRGK